MLPIIIYSLAFQLIHFQIYVFKCLATENMELRSSESWLGIRNFSLFLFLPIPRNDCVIFPLSSPHNILDNQ